MISPAIAAQAPEITYAHTLTRFRGTPETCSARSLPAVAEGQPPIGALRLPALIATAMIAMIQIAVGRPSGRPPPRKSNPVLPRSGEPPRFGYVEPSEISSASPRIT